VSAYEPGFPGVQFFNDGAVNVGTNATFYAAAGGSATGSFTAAAGSQLSLGNLGEYDIAASGQITSAGQVILHTGTMAGTYDVTGSGSTAVRLAEPRCSGIPRSTAPVPSRCHSYIDTSWTRV
jgi:hypothetical protein